MRALLAFLAISAALLTITGCGTSFETPAQAATPASQSQRIEEDDPRWDCSTMGNKVCAANTLERLEAWHLFKTGNLPENTLKGAFRVTYRGLALAGVDFPPSEHLTVPSSITPAKVHVFHIQQYT